MRREAYLGEADLPPLGVSGDAGRARTGAASIGYGTADDGASSSNS